MLQALLDLVFPRACAGCGRGMEDPGYLCWDCLARTLWVRPPFCELCGDPFHGLVPQPAVCPRCAARLPAFDRARSAARFQGVLREAVHAFKYGGATWLAADLIRLAQPVFDEYFALANLDIVTYVPLFPARERERGYNQARLLARGLAATRPGLALRACLRRIRPTPSQTRLTATERHANVRAAFAARTRRGAINGRRILLVDDVMTTGATVNECARVLKEAGAALVGVLTVGRG